MDFMSTTSQSDDKAHVLYIAPAEPHRRTAFILAALIHLVLLAGLWLGARQMNHGPIKVESVDSSRQVLKPIPEAVAETPVPIRAASVTSSDSVTPVSPTRAIIAKRGNERPLSNAQQKVQRHVKLASRRHETANRNKRQISPKTARVHRKETETVALIKGRAAREKARAHLLAKRKQATHTAQILAEKKRLQELTESRQLDLLREAEMRRIKAGSRTGVPTASTKSLQTSRNAGHS